MVTDETPRYERPIVRMVAAYALDDGKKVYRDKQSIYYEAAKRIVEEVYPRWITSVRMQSFGSIPESARRKGWTLELAQRRANRATRLFWGPLTGDAEFDAVFTMPVFNSEKFRRFVRRLANFLMFVDRRRSVQQLIEHLPTDDVQAQSEYLENRAAQFAEASQHYRAELDRRMNIQVSEFMRREGV